ncbi:MAG: helix-hairpin-helix domain-containing protein [Myxococcota bacterium]|jgi:competence protein ComEA|nr:helix-hairpin-helix domain-containing protein [Myxococcota bacterium]
MKNTKIHQLLCAIVLVAACAAPLAIHAAPAAPTASAAAQTAPAVVNVNTATETELAYLPGIGPSRAQAIVAHRAKTPFKKVDDLTRIKGIGPKSLNKIRSHVTLDGPTTAKAPIRMDK